WRSRFGAAPDIVGRTLTMNGNSYTVIGVVDVNHAWPPRTLVWTATAMKVPEHPLRPQEDQSTIRDSRYLDVIARMAPGVTIAARIALGATRARLAMLFFAESAILALAGGALGVTFALWAAPLLVALGPSSMRALPVAVDGRVLVFTAAVALLTAVVFGVVPA